MGKDRIVWLDYMRAFSICCVVLYHTQLPSLESKIVYYISLPAFFFCSGYCFNSDKSARHFFIERAQRLLVPYVAAGLLSYVLWLARNTYGVNATDTPWWYPLFGMLYGTSDKLVHNAPLWFLPMLFCLETLFFYISKIKDTRLRWDVIGTLWSIEWIINSICPIPIVLPWGITTSVMMMLIFALSYEIKQRGIPTTICGKPITISKYNIGVISFVIASVSYDLNRKICDIKISMSQFGFPPIYMIGAAAIIALWWLVAYQMSKMKVRFLLTSYMGRNTLAILCWHIPMFTIIKAVTYYLLHIPLDIYESAKGRLLLFVVSIAVILLACKLWDWGRSKQFFKQKL